MYSFVCKCGWFLLVLLFSQAVWAEDGRPDCGRPFTLGLHVHGLLYSADLDAGIDKDFADTLSQRSGCSIQTSVLPRARIWQLIESGALDFSLSGIATEERNTYADFAWYFSNKYYLLVNKSTHVQKLSDFEGQPAMKLGAIRSFRYSTNANRMVDKLAQAGRVSYASGLDPLYQVLILGRIQGMVIEPFDIGDVEAKRIKDTTQIIEFNDPPVPHGLIISKKSISPAEITKWVALVQSMRNDGTVLRIFEKYFPPALAREMVVF
ncbi:MAG: transporter substrate-binding domain-containing protein [Rhodoferax sp.]|uniref:substrate-binding periplasmic protein n=1 Tax=Rhodoferax sp. TaxID=50421 RepID=UPI003266E3E6